MLFSLRPGRPNDTPHGKAVIDIQNILTYIQVQEKPTAFIKNKVYVIIKHGPLFRSTSVTCSLHQSIFSRTLEGQCHNSKKEIYLFRFSLES